MTHSLTVNSFYVSCFQVKEKKKNLYSYIASYIHSLELPWTSLSCISWAAQSPEHVDIYILNGWSRWIQMYCSLSCSIAYFVGPRTNLAPSVSKPKVTCSIHNCYGQTAIWKCNSTMGPINQDKIGHRCSDRHQSLCLSVLVYTLLGMELNIVWGHLNVDRH